VSNRSPILAVDAGNTRVKWALHDGSSFVRDGSRMLGEAARLATDWSDLPDSSAAIAANVAGAAVEEALAIAARRFKHGLRFVTANTGQCGVTNRYRDTAQLGPDRWAALIAARALGDSPHLVVCAGTAVTIDALLADGTFVGGVIVPGFDLMHQSLGASTARLSAERGSFQAFPRSTRDAITTGTIHAICGAIERMRAMLLTEARGEPRIVVSGGAAAIVALHLGRPVRVHEKLVLEGLVRIAASPA
jgi:type III pantothenate kinase